MTARQEKVREAMGLMASAAQSREPYTPQVAAAIAAALAEVEEWETRLAEALEDAHQLHHRAEAAEAERDRLREAMAALLADDDLPYPPDGDTCHCSMCVAVRNARAALGEQT